MNKTKDELLVENAVLKYNEQVRKMLQEELSPLKKEVTGIDTRLTKVENRLEVYDETLKPFTSFRRKLWQSLIFTVLGFGVGLLIYSEIYKVR